MDRCAILIDAGHLLAESGKLVCNTKNRALIQCDYPAMLGDLAAMIEEDADMPVLRTYWYDAAPDAIPTFEQLRIADLPGVKIRLGRLTRGQQKGVDSLIYRDLVRLARERAVANVYLLGGDDDLLDGMTEAQDFGLHVTVVGVESVAGRNQSGTLVREADDHIVLKSEFWSQYITPAPETADIAMHDTAQDGEEAGEQFALAWAARSSQDELMGLVQMAPRIPKELDVQLLMATQRSLDETTLDRDTKYAARAGFWRSIKRAARGEVVHDEVLDEIEDASVENETAV